MLYLYCFFFFKQKTAYEMRISDWSSDVCSSDLGHVGDARSYGGHDGAEDRTSQGGGVDRLGSLANGCDAACAPLSSGECRAGAGGTGGAAQDRAWPLAPAAACRGQELVARGNPRGAGQ